MIWLSEWSRQTLESIPKMLIQKYVIIMQQLLKILLKLFLIYSANKTSKEKNNSIEICNGFVELQNIINVKIATPLRYIYLIKTYIDIYLDKKNFITSKMEKLQVTTKNFKLENVNENITF